MRNLSIASSSSSSQLSSAYLSSAAFDAEQDCIYVLSENFGQIVERSVEAEIFKMESKSLAEELPVPIATFAISSISSEERSQIASLRFLAESQSLGLITLGGDIGLISVENDCSGQFEVIGSIDNGIKAASWSPDDSIVAIVTGDKNLLLMTSTFDVLTESPLHSSDKGEDEPVNVGWGSKQTQFHGSLGKTAAQAPQMPANAIGSSPDDDLSPRISWRGDGAFFVVSSLEEVEARPRRLLRVYDRQGVLQNKSEPVAGLEHPLSWRPSGNLIVGTQRFGFEGGGLSREGRHDVVFFERNGLRHGEFTLREVGKARMKDHQKRQWGYKVKDLLWNSDSNILAVWIERDEGDLVQLWTTGNYHWYLKQEILSPSEGGQQRRFTYVLWHPEDALRLILVTSTQVLQRTLNWETYISRTRPPIDTGCVAVTDGANILLTPFRTQNIPPPMSSCQLSTHLDLNAVAGPNEQGRTPRHVAFSPTGDHFAVLDLLGHVQLWNLRTRVEFSRAKALDPVRYCKIDSRSLIDVDDEFDFRQVGLWKMPSTLEMFRVACLSSNAEVDVVLVLEVIDKNAKDSRLIHLPSRDGRLLNSDSGLYWESKEGEIFDAQLPRAFADPIARFPEFCLAADCVSTSESGILLVGHTESGKLYCATAHSSSSHLLSSNCTSFIVASGFVIYTTTTHEAFFAPLPSLLDLLSSAMGVSVEGGISPTAVEPPQWERRRVERGSRIVTAIPSTMSLVLQMPRGNLETINPRPMVLKVIKQEIEEGNYLKAFLACRKHRIDFDVFVEHNPNAFMGRISSFVDQIDDVDHLNLFLTSFGQSSQDPSRVSELCDTIRVELESRSITKYVNTILTAYAVRKPADYEAGLSLLHRLREIDVDLVEEAVKYIIFLVDADRLFDTALGMYDYSLVLLIAQHSQRDPREYLPFLRELRALPKFYQMHRIDDHLKRHARALKNLSLSGQEYFEEALAYTEKHRLYAEALHIWKADEAAYKRVLEIYGEYLFECREFRQAALVFVDAHSFAKALVAYERALLWRELFELAMQESTEDEALRKLAYRVADELLSKKRYDEAARVFLDYAKDLRQSISTLAQGNLFSEARRLIALHGEPSLVADILHPMSLDNRAQIAEDLEEMKVQLRKQLERIKELRVKQVEDPGVFYGLDDDPTLHNVDVMTDVSMTGTAFTRYTVAPTPTTTSRASRKTSRSKRKMERKVGSGRKGTIDEEEYLLKSVGKIVSRFDTVQGEIAHLLSHLLQFTAEHRAEASAMQHEVASFRKELQSALDEIWTTKSVEGETESSGEPIAVGWAERIEEKRREKRLALERILKPEMGSSESSWRVDVLDI